MPILYKKTKEKILSLFIEDWNKISIKKAVLKGKCAALKVRFNKGVCVCGSCT